MSRRILIVEDDAALARVLKDNLECEGFLVESAADGRDALHKARQFALEAVYINPYDVSAHELLAEIYEKTANQAGLEKERRVVAVLKDWSAKRKGERDGATMRPRPATHRVTSARKPDELRGASIAAARNVASRIGSTPGNRKATAVGGTSPVTSATTVVTSTSSRRPSARNA
jgi:CheY-like chemotaxis protein